jgi:hypothetical protein
VAAAAQAAAKVVNRGPGFVSHDLFADGETAAAVAGA